MERTDVADWYTLFSRGARDWLRHNQKVRAAVREQFPELIATEHWIGASGQRTVQVPVKILEHAKFRLAEGRSQVGVGQGEARPDDKLLPGPAGECGSGGGCQDGAFKLVLEFTAEELLDWLWEELRLPHLQPAGQPAMQDARLERDGWDRHGVRSRLDRRRTLKEAIRRRAQQSAGPAIVNEDLRFRQLSLQRQKSANAVVFLVIDVSASMTTRERKLAKSYFYFSLQGLRRKYGSLVVRFIAHTTRAWEFVEQEFFQVSGSGGTLASTAFQLIAELLHDTPEFGTANVYILYASDGENFPEDRQASTEAIQALAPRLRHMAYAETIAGQTRALESETRRLCNELGRRGLPIRSCVISTPDDVWRAIRQFFVQEMGEMEAQP